MIKLSDLRDYWKNVSDWIKGEDEISSPKVEVTNLPETQNVTVENQVESVEISNFPETQSVNVENQIDSVEVSNLPETQDVNVINSVNVQLDEISVNNFPETQNVNVVNQLQSVEVSNLPSVQEVESPDILNELTELKQRLEQVENKMNDNFKVEVESNSMEFYGNSTDSKPENVKIGSTFFEIDTKEAYMYDGDSWEVL